MKLTKQTKVYAGILGLGLVALVADRALLSPAGAAAAVDLGTAPAPHAAPAAASIASEPAAASTDGPAASAGAPISARLRAVAKEAEKAPEFSGDAFAPAVAAVQDASPARVTPASAELFRAQNRLTGLIHGGDSGAALIDGRPVRVGEVVSGFMLTRVDAHGATFERDGERVTLTPAELAPGRSPVRKEIHSNVVQPLK